LIAPSAADETSAAYFAITPLVHDSVGDLDVEPPLGNVEGDDVALRDGGDRAAHRRLGRDVPRHEAAGRAAEAAVGEERHVLVEAGAHERCGDAEHLAHAGAAARALVADDDAGAARGRRPSPRNLRGRGCPSG
jgi:hypothetical protein